MAFQTNDKEVLKYCYSLDCSLNHYFIDRENRMLLISFNEQFLIHSIDFKTFKDTLEFIQKREKKSNEVLFAEWIAENHFRLYNVKDGVFIWKNETDSKTSQELYDRYIKTI